MSGLGFWLVEFYFELGQKVNFGEIPSTNTVADQEGQIVKNQTKGTVARTAAVSKPIPGAEVTSCEAAQSIKELGSWLDRRLL